MGVAALATLAGCAPAGTEQVTYVAMLGPDTVVVERVRRTADSLSGHVGIRSPGGELTQHARYAAALAPQGLVSEIVVALPARASTPGSTKWVRMGRDTAGSYAALMDGTDPRTSRRAATQRDAVPTISVSIGLLEQVLRRARNIPGDSVTVPVFVLDDERTMPASARFTRDSVRLVTDSETLMLRTDAAGRILGGGDPARQLRITRAFTVPRGWLPPTVR